MGLSFLAPLFFAGLAALAIPIIVHLTHRQKANVVPFPSVAERTVNDDEPPC